LWARPRYSESSNPRLIDWSSKRIGDSVPYTPIGVLEPHKISDRHHL
jgi:hypothetical protein